MADGFKIGSAYVTVTAQADQTSADTAGKTISATAKKSAGKITLQAALDAAQVKVDAQKAADEARAKVKFDAAIDAAQLLDEEDRAAAETKAKVTYTTAIDAAELKAKADLAAEEAKARITITAQPDEDSARRAGKKVGQDASQAAQDSTQSGGDLAGKLLIGGIVAAAPVAGAAILAGVGAGFIGLGALAVDGNQQVQAAWKDLENAALATGRSASQGLAGPFTTAIDDLKTTTQAAEPALAQIFSGIKPDIPIVTAGIQAMADNAIPGLENAARNSQPVMQGVANAMGDMGTLGNDALTTLSNNSRNFGAVMSSTGSIVQSVGGAAINVVSDLGTVWGTNAAGMSSAIKGVANDISGVASGAVPVLGEELTIVTNDISGLASALGPLTPVLGAVGTTALTTWGAFKGASAVSSGVESLAGGVLTLGTKVESAAPKVATFLGDLAATGEEVAGPLGLAIVGGTIALGAFAQIGEKAAISQADLQSASQNLSSQLQASNGALTEATTAALQNQQAYKDLVPLMQQLGVSGSAVTAGIEGQGNAYSAEQAKLQAIIDANTKYTVVQGTSQAVMNGTAEAAQKLLNGYNALHGTFQQAVSDAKASAQAAQEQAQAQQQANIQLLAATGINFAGPAGTIAASLQTIGDKASTDAQKVSGLSTELQALVNPGGAAISTLAGISSSEQGLGQQLDGLKGRIADQAGDLDLTTQKGAAAASAIEQLSTNYTQYTAQAEQAGTPIATINANLQVQYNNLLATVQGFGLSKSAAAQYLSQLGIIPPQVTTQIAQPNMQQAIANIVNLHGQIVGVPTTTTVTATALTATAISTLESLGYTVTHLPNGQVQISVDTSKAENAIDTFLALESNRVIPISVQVNSNEGPLGKAHAFGGIVGHADGGVLTPTPAVAQFARPNSWLDVGGRGTDVVGDRSDVDEAYIPLDGSPRSRSILREANRRMPGGPGATPHADGGFSGGITTPVNVWNIAPVVKTDSPNELATKVAAEVQWKLMATVGG